MKIIETSLPGVVIIEPEVHRDGRGFFTEIFRADIFEARHLPASFVQENRSRSMKGTLRGIHLQHPHSQGKLVRVTRGEVFDVAVDVRMGSPTFGRWFSTRLDAEEMRQMYIPPGFAHGFCVLSDDADFQYSCTDFYAPECEFGIIWNDPALAIPWPAKDPILSAKDRRYPCLAEIPAERLPRWDYSC